MNKKIVFFAAVLLAACAMPGRAAQYVSPVLVNESGLTYNNTYYISLDTTPFPQNGISRLSAQIIYSSMSPANDSFNTGQVSVASITVVSTQPLVATFATNKITVPGTNDILPYGATNQITINLGVSASNYLTVISTFGLVNTTVTVNGVTFRNVGTATGATDWVTGTNVSSSAANLVTAMNTYFAGVINSTSVGVAGTFGVTAQIGSTATYAGTAGNSYTFASSTPTCLSTGAPTFSGGLNPQVPSSATITVNGNVLRVGIEWSTGTLTSVTAANIASAINTYIGALDATSAGNVVFATATNAGVGGNSFTLASNLPLVLTTASFNFQGGHDNLLRNASFIFNGTTYRNGYQWTDTSGTSSGTAASISALLNSLGVIKSSPPADSVVTATATNSGYAANAYTLTASTALVVYRPTFIGGQDSATVTINGVVLTAGVQGANGFAVGATPAATAINLSSAIMNTPALSAVIVSTTVGFGTSVTTVYATSTVTGLTANYTITLSTNALSSSPTGFSGGAPSSTTINTAVITLASHGYSTGLAVVYSSGTGVQLKPLWYNTTYYVIVIDANHIALASSLGNAIAGSSVTFTSSSTLTTTASFTLTPSTLNGQASWKWQVSNDGSTWTDLATPATYTVTGYVFPSTSTVVDFGDVDYQALRMFVTSPVAGGIKLRVPLNGKIAP